MIRCSGKHDTRPGFATGTGAGVSRGRRDNAGTLTRVVGEGAPDFAAVNAAALSALPALVTRWLPSGRREGREWVALNPHRVDLRLGSFRVNLQTGQWADFALTDARGGDPVSLVACLSMAASARRTAGTPRSAPSRRRRRDRRTAPPRASGRTAVPPELRIPMKAATDSDGKRPLIPIQNGHFGRGSNWAS